MAQMLALYTKRIKGWVGQQIELKGIRAGEEVEVYQVNNKNLAILAMIQVFSQPSEGATMEKAEEFGVEVEVALVEGSEEEMEVVVEDLEEEAGVVVGEEGLEEMGDVAEVLEEGLEEMEDVAEVSEIVACE